MRCAVPKTGLALSAVTSSASAAASSSIATALIPVPITPSPYHPMTLRAIDPNQLREYRQVVRTGVAADPRGEGAEVRGVPDVIDSKQGWQAKLAQRMPAIGQ